MLSSLLKEHQRLQSQRRAAQDARRAEVATGVASLTTALVDGLNSGVAQAYANQRRLDCETKALQASVTTFARQTGQWIKLVEDLNSALKEMGDVENWARSMERDMRIVVGALESAYAEHGQAQAL
ncbi:hypothetical protein BOX15_Mlig034571g1 [Macrostomum lignano]|uniref:Biogenesis of lysosome-related organelles complex 1 subunit 1 n=1 Tax=Macrostomum lignano TaxID=282301 RepID=A0A267GHL1_9PLAT|nr:hypothetical protein BOX15_Mlig034571g4 [Macrostomum lignano]PAA85531.1 hypothetical protein BOX15_Mlig034571g1 [Macrostomum lignano]